MSLRREFLSLARRPGSNVSALCRRYGISRKTGYKWLGRDELEDRSRRPASSPSRTSAAIEQAVLELRAEHPDWGARKLKRVLQNRGRTGLPAVSTITAILHRHGCISEAASEAAQRWQRFEHEAPNALWQMDFKGHFALAQGRCHPLTVLDDHSRYNVVLTACVGETFEEVKPHLEGTFQRYGMPERISCDNGPPWGTMHREDGLTRLGAWLIRLGIKLTHARPRHPQTNGKDERFHRTLGNGLLKRRQFNDCHDAQVAFDRFRSEYNHDRPHDALGLNVPASRYRPSDRSFPSKLPVIEYETGDAIRLVDRNGRISYDSTRFRISRALIGEPVAVRTDPDHADRLAVFYCHQRVRWIDLKTQDPTD